MTAPSSAVVEIVRQPALARVLLIEDDDLDVISFYRSLEARGLKIELQRARDAIEAFDMLRLQRSEGRDDNMLVVLDLNMPCMNGIEFLQQLRADAELGSAIVIVFTTSSNPKDIEAAYRHHVAAYVVKEVVEDSTKNLVALIDSYLRTVTMPVR